MLLETGIQTTTMVAAIGYAIRFLVAKVGVTKLEKGFKVIQTHKELARIAVQFAQEAYGEFSGRARFDVASEYLSNQLNKRGFKTDSTHVEALIKSALIEAKKDFGDAWSASMSSTQTSNDTTYVLSGEDKSQTGQPSIK